MEAGKKTVNKTVISGRFHFNGQNLQKARVNDSILTHALDEQNKQIILRSRTTRRASFQKSGQRNSQKK